MNLRRDQKGFSLVELTSVITVVALLTAVAAYGISIFFYKFKVLTYYTDLQQDAMDVLMEMKNGVPVAQDNSSVLLGIASSTAMTFPAGVSMYGSSDEVTCTPTSVAEGGNHSNDYIRFYWDKLGGTFKAKYQYGGVSPSGGVVLFPISHKDITRVTDLEFNFLENSSKSVLHVIFEAEIQVTTKEVRRVHYETYMRISWL
jgi:prepilin-type N-terminal cleavage/methylation domain-containing protein